MNSSVKFIQGTDVINSYLSDVRKYKVLSEDEERELLIKAKNGDRKAQDELILRNQRYVYSQAKIYATNEDDIMDYVQEGNIGLIEALSQFDVEKDNKFLTYARWYIKQKMNRYMEEMHDIVYQSNRQKYGKRIEKIKAEYLANENRIRLSRKLWTDMRSCTEKPLRRKVMCMISQLIQLTLA